jgi:hypothetical protein
MSGFAGSRNRILHALYEIRVFDGKTCDVIEKMAAPPLDNVATVGLTGPSRMVDENLSPSSGNPARNENLHGAITDLIARSLFVNPERHAPRRGPLIWGLLNRKALIEREERQKMLKYASKIFLELFLSVLATVIGSYLAHQYIAERPGASGSVSLADVTVSPKKVDPEGMPRETVKADVAVSVGSSDVVNALGPAAVGGRIAGQTNDENAAPTVDKRAEPTSALARLRRSALREKRVSKTNTIAAPAIASPTVAPPEPGRVSAERFLNTNANSRADASPTPQRIGEGDGVSPSPDPGMPRSHFASRILKPIIRTALLILEPSSLVDHVHEPEWRTPPGESHSSSRMPHLQPQVTGRLSSEGSSISNDGLSSRRPEAKALEQWP